MGNINIQGGNGGNIENDPNYCGLRFKFEDDNIKHIDNPIHKRKEKKK